MTCPEASEVVLAVHRLDQGGALELSKALWLLPEAKTYVVDFATLEWTEPFGMLYFARQLRAFADSRKPAKCRAVNHERHRYAAHMGFFQTFGLKFGNSPGEAPGSLQYLPLTGLTVAELEYEAADKGIDVREVIERHCARLAAILMRNAEDNAQTTLTYSLRELFRNVLEHSRADTIWFAAQCWPGRELVEVSILDQGTGLRQSLARNPHLVIDSDEDALRLALLPGISGVAYKGSRTRRRDEWANSGYGLFMTSQLCAQGGSFFVASGQRGLTVTGDSAVAIEAGFAGTALRLELYLPELGNLNESLEQLRRRGSEIAGDLRGGGALTASMSSRMLSKDFPK